MSMGNPDGPTPKHIVASWSRRRSEATPTAISVSKGIPRLRRAICSWYQRRYGVEFDPDSEAIVTIGSKEGLAHLMLASWTAATPCSCQPLVPDPHLTARSSPAPTSARCA